MRATKSLRALPTWWLAAIALVLVHSGSPAGAQDYAAVLAAGDRSDADR